VESNQRRWYSVVEAAVMLGMSKQTLWRRVRDGVIELPRVDGRLVVPATRLAELSNSPTVPGRRYQRRPAGGSPR
jgi:excisionase family DNA binding protein